MTLAGPQQVMKKGFGVFIFVIQYLALDTISISQ